LITLSLRPMTSNESCRMILPQRSQTYKPFQPEPGSTSLPAASQGKKPSECGSLPQMQIHASLTQASSLINSLVMGMVIKSDKASPVDLAGEVKELTAGYQNLWY